MKTILITLCFLSSCSTSRLMSGHAISMKHEYLPFNKELVLLKEVDLKYCPDSSKKSSQGYIDSLLLGAHKKYKADFFMNFDILREQKLFGKDCFQLKGTVARTREKR